MKLFAIAVSLIIAGVIFVGAGNVASVDYAYIDSSTMGMESNASFVAPVPVNVSFHEYLLPHEIWIGTPEFFLVMEGK